MSQIYDITIIGGAILCCSFYVGMRSKIIESLDLLGGASLRSHLRYPGPLLPNQRLTCP